MSEPDKRATWKRLDDGAWWAWLGNGLWMVCSPEVATRHNLRSKRSHEYRVWRSAVVCGKHWVPIPTESVVRASCFGTHRTLVAAKRACIDDARAVSHAIADILEQNHGITA